MPYDLIRSGKRRRIISKMEEETFIEPASMRRRKEIQMKGNGKKLGVFVMIAAIAMFAGVSTASAWWWPYHNAIEGVFAVTGISSCSPEDIPASPGVFEGDYTFRPDGTVSVSNGFVRNIPGVAPTTPVSGEFKYTVTRAGRIEFQYPEGGFAFGGVHLNMGPSHGVISEDGNTITITCGPPVGPLWLIDDSTGGKIPGTDMWCVTTFSGIRLR